MKSIQSKIVILIVLLFSFSLFAQEVKVPKNVKTAFDKLYPNAKDVKWEEEGEEEYEASFIDGTTHISIVIDDEGEVEETETVISLDKLPKSIHEFVEKNYSEYKITEAAKILDDKGVITFEAEITKGKEKKDLMFDANGKSLKKESKDSDEDEDGEDEE